MSSDLPWLKHLRTWGPVALGLAALFVPTFHDLFNTVWREDEQGHGPIILGISLWLVYRKWPAAMQDTPFEPAPVAGWLALGFGLLCYVVGRSQAIVQLEAGAIIPVFIGLALIYRGWAALRALWFPLFFMIFMVPLPGVFVQMLTIPLKTGVSIVVENILFWFGYPIARTGVILQVGQYQMLVADACAGLHTLFTLEAIGLLYMNLVGHESLKRNLFLATLIVPISFTANVIRVMVLVLITYYFGDEAGQGFLHGFAGMTLFLSALVLIISVDTALGKAFKGQPMLKLGQQIGFKASLVVGLMMAAAAVTANTYKPTLRLADIKPKITLDSQVPTKFGPWYEDRSIVPVLPNPELQAKIDALYSATLARTYRNDAGQRVMLTIAYGSDQSSEATQVHRPEYCYSAQGFRISGRGEATVKVGEHTVRVQRLVATLGQRTEPITYWITLDEMATLPGLDRKLAQLRYGLRGQIPDGLLFRISTVGLAEAESFAVQEQFANDLYRHMDQAIAPRYFGS